MANKKNICYILIVILKHALLKLEKGKLLERVGRKAVSLNLSGDEQGCLVAEAIKCLNVYVFSLY